MIKNNLTVEEITAGIMIKVGDDITTDTILPISEEEAKSDIESICKSLFYQIDEKFIDRVKLNSGGLIVAGENYGVGEGHKIAKLFASLGIKAILAKSFDKEHKKSLIENGILPIEFIKDENYQGVDLYDILKIKDIPSAIAKRTVEVINLKKGDSFIAKIEL